MAKIVFEGLEEYQATLSELAKHSNAIVKPAVYEGAAVAIDAVKAELRKVVSDEATGDLEDSIGLSKMQDDYGFINTKIGFDGYDRNGHPNIVKAIALEKGTSKQRKRPFIRPAMKKAEESVLNAMQTEIDKQIKKLTERS